MIVHRRRALAEFLLETELAAIVVKLVGGRAAIDCQWLPDPSDICRRPGMRFYTGNKVNHLFEIGLILRSHVHACHPLFIVHVRVGKSDPLSSEYSLEVRSMQKWIIYGNLVCGISEVTDNMSECWIVCEPSW